MSDSDVSKRCNQCGLTKQLTSFYRNPAGRKGRRPECKECTKERRKEWYARNRAREIARVGAWQRQNPEKLAKQRMKNVEERARKHRNWHLQKRFGLTLEQYGQLLSKQDARCAICGDAPEGRTLHVDHDHETGEVRGLLCMRCNNALGLFREDPDALTSALDYLFRRDPDGLDPLADARARELVGAG